MTQKYAFKTSPSLSCSEKKVRTSETKLHTTLTRMANKHLPCHLFRVHTIKLLEKECRFTSISNSRKKKFSPEHSLKKPLKHTPPKCKTTTLGLNLDCDSVTKAAHSATSIGTKAKKTLVTSNSTSKNRASFENVRRKIKAPKPFFLIHTCSFIAAGRTEQCRMWVFRSSLWD